MRTLLITLMLALAGCGSLPESIAYSDRKKMDAHDRCVERHAFDDRWVGTQFGPTQACHMVPYYLERRVLDAGQ